MAVAPATAAIARPADAIGSMETALWMARLSWDHPLQGCVVCARSSSIGVTASSVTCVPGAGPDGGLLGLHVQCITTALRLGLLPDATADLASPSVPLIWRCISGAEVSPRERAAAREIWEWLAPYYDK